MFAVPSELPKSRRNKRKDDVLLSPIISSLGNLNNQIQNFPSPLKKITSKNNELELDRKYPPDNKTKIEKAGKVGIVYFATSQPGNKKVVVKKQATSHSEVGYRELFILQHLHKTLHNHRNFISLYDWNKSRMDTKYVNFIMEAAEESLLSISKKYTISIHLFRHFLFQTLYSLCIAQKSCNFIHNDLHFNNLLVSLQSPHSHQPSNLNHHSSSSSSTTTSSTTNSYTKNHHNYCEYKALKKSQPGSWYTHPSICIKIIDFGLSSITLEDGTVIQNHANTSSNNESDVIQLAHYFAKFKVYYDDDDDDNDDDNNNNDDDNNSDDCEAVKAHKVSILTAMKKGQEPFRLLYHPFFQPLTIQPSSPPPSFQFLVRDINMAAPFSLKQFCKQISNEDDNIGDQKHVVTNVDMMNDDNTLSGGDDDDHLSSSTDDDDTLEDETTIELNDDDGDDEMEISFERDDEEEGVKVVEYKDVHNSNDNDNDNGDDDDVHSQRSSLKKDNSASKHTSNEDNRRETRITRSKQHTLHATQTQRNDDVNVKPKTAITNNSGSNRSNSISSSNSSSSSSIAATSIKSKSTSKLTMTTSKRGKNTKQTKGEEEMNKENKINKSQSLVLPSTSSSKKVNWNSLNIKSTSNTRYPLRSSSFKQ